MARMAAVLMLICFSAPSFCQQPPPRDPQAVAVANQSLSAMGAAALAQLNNDQLTLVAFGTYVQYGGDTPAQYPFRVKVRGWDKIRWEVDRPEGTVVMLFVGDAGWSITPDGKTHILGTSALAGRHFEKLPFLAMAHWMASPRASIRTLGTLTDQSMTFHRLAMSRPSSRENTEESDRRFHQMSRCEVDIEAATSLPAKLRYFEHLGDARIELPMDLVFTNYQAIQGMQVPLTVTRFLRNQRMDEHQFSAIEFYANVPDSDFALGGQR